MLTREQVETAVYHNLFESLAVARGKIANELGLECKQVIIEDMNHIKITDEEVKFDIRIGG